MRYSILLLMFCVAFMQFCSVSSYALHLSDVDDFSQQHKIDYPKRYLSAAKKLLEKKIAKVKNDLQSKKSLADKLKDKREAIKEKLVSEKKNLFRLRRVFQSAQSGKLSWPVTVQGQSYTESRLKSKVGVLLDVKERNEEILKNLNSEIASAEKRIKSATSKKANLASWLTQIQSDKLVLESNPDLDRVKRIIKRIDQAVAQEALAASKTHGNVKSSITSSEDFYVGEKADGSAVSFLKSTKGYVEDLLDEAAKDIRSGRLTIPADDNAMQKYQKVLELDTDNDQAKKGLDRIADRFLNSAENLIDKDRFHKAKQKIQKVKTIGVRNREVRNLLARIENRKKSIRKNRIASILEDGRESLNAGRLISPKGHNALETFKQVLTMDPGNQEAVKGLKIIVRKFLEKSEKALKSLKIDDAKFYVTRAETVGVLYGDIQNMKRKIEKGPHAGDRWIEPTTGIEFVYIPGGCFIMGHQDTKSKQSRENFLHKTLAVLSGLFPVGCARIDKPGAKRSQSNFYQAHGYYQDESPGHEVCLDGFWMSKYEITIDQYRQYLKNTGNIGGVDEIYKYFDDKTDFNLSGHKLSRDKDQPMMDVSWNGATSYAIYISKVTGFDVRLPTEAQWEYAAKGGTNSEFWWGNSISCDKAMIENEAPLYSHSDHDCFSYFKKKGLGQKTASVGSFAPNPFGINDMLGNVSEWCRDVYDLNAYSKHENINPVITSGGSEHVIRGGNWRYSARYARIVSRYKRNASSCSSAVGFRLIMRKVR